MDLLRSLCCLRFNSRVPNQVPPPGGSGRFHPGRYSRRISSSASRVFLAFNPVGRGAAEQHRARVAYQDQVPARRIVDGRDRFLLRALRFSFRRCWFGLGRSASRLRQQLVRRVLPTVFLAIIPNRFNRRLFDRRLGADRAAPRAAADRAREANWYVIADQSGPVSFVAWPSRTPRHGCGPAYVERIVRTPDAAGKEGESQRRGGCRAEKLPAMNSWFAHLGPLPWGLRHASRRDSVGGPRIGGRWQTDGIHDRRRWC